MTEEEDDDGATVDIDSHDGMVMVTTENPAYDARFDLPDSKYVTLTLSPALARELAEALTVKSYEIEAEESGSNED